ncbi:MAG TPA: hypothetical protein VLK37_03760 [Solirubrobacterales bacterium]|nr:hypothetical protein [Solirubrobacterales bacterium]
MSAFFEAPPPQPKTEPAEPRMPVWFQAPRGQLPCAIPLGRIIARNDKAVVGVAGGFAYTTGFELSFHVFTPEATFPEGGFERGPFDRMGLDSGELSPEFLRLGLEYADGSKLMNTNPRPLPDGDGDDEEQAKPTMRPQRGRGWYREYQQDFWCWPLPPVGPLQLICEWPGMEIDLTRVEVDAQSILDASAQTQIIIPSE